MDKRVWSLVVWGRIEVGSPGIVGMDLVGGRVVVGSRVWGFVDNLGSILALSF
jgi:hypothetical protein